MNIKKIHVVNEGFSFCKSAFYSVHDVLSPEKNHEFSTGINILQGEIDSGIWTVSYLLSMYKYCKEDFILFKEDVLMVNGKRFSLNSFAQYSCYMDRLHPLFSSADSVKTLIQNGVEQEEQSNPLEIKDLFHLDSRCYERPLSGSGNEIFKAMAAIGYAHNKQVFCFPWLSRTRFASYHNYMCDLFDTLKSLNMIVIVPIGK